MSSKFTILLIAAAGSGLVWGVAIAGASATVGGLDSPFAIVVSSLIIGVANGVASKWIYLKDWRLLIPWSLATLYVSVAMLTAMCVTFEMIVNPVIGILPPRSACEIVAEGVLFIVVGFTTQLYALIGWPLAFCNHWMLRRLLHSGFALGPK